jgi:hypothetical protein
LRSVERRGRYETAKRLRALFGMVFRYAIATSRAERDPTGDLRGALTIHQVNHRATIVEPRAICVSGLSGASDPQCGRRARDGADALGHATASKPAVRR